MAYFNESERKVVLRIVYDGPAKAGKTTNLRQLCGFFTPRRRSEMIVPEEAEGRTLFFDWLRVDGGVIAGYSVRCQLLTVPGQKELRHRREHILRLADAVVLVCESTPAGVDDARVFLEELRDRDGLPVVIQTNKQDLDGAVSPEDVVTRLGTEDSIPVMPATAHQGLGVRETLVVGIRHAAGRTQDIIFASGLDALDSDACDAEELHRQMLVLAAPSDEDGSAPETSSTTASSADETTVAPVEFTVPEPGPAARGETSGSESGYGYGRNPSDTETATEKAAATAASATDAQPQVQVQAQVQAQAEPEPELEPPSPGPNVQAGSIWPASPGRSHLKSLEGTPRHRRRELEAQKGAADGSAKSDVYIYRAGEFCLKTSVRRSFDNLGAARASLLRLARQKTQLGELLPPDTVLSIQEDSRGNHWLWTVTPWLETLRSRMAAGDENDDVKLLGDALVLFADAAVISLALAARKALVLDVHPNNFVTTSGNITYIDDDIGSGSVIPTIGQTLLQRVDEYPNRADAIDRYLTRVEERIVETLSREEADKLDLCDFIAGARPRSPLAQAAQGRLREAVTRCRSTAAVTLG